MTAPTANVNASPRLAPSTTVAVYAGPSFRRGVRASAALTDHRALLGVLLGVSTPPSYLGPELRTIFAPDALTPDQLRQLPALRAPAHPQGNSTRSLLLSGLTLACALIIAQKLLKSVGLPPALRWLLPLVFGFLLAFVGCYYDAFC